MKIFGSTHSTWRKRTNPGVCFLSAMLLAVAGTSRASVIDWKEPGSSTAWSLGANWLGGVAPANSLTSDVARFDQTNYTFLPNAGTTSVAGIQFGDGTTTTAALTLSGTTLSLGGGGVNVAANAGPVTIASPVTIGAAQSWTNNSASLLTATGTVATGSNVLTIAGAGNAALAALTGTGGVAMSGSGTLTLNNTLNVVGQLLKITSGTVSLKSGRDTQSNVEVDGGVLNINGADRYSTSANHQTFTVTDGQVNCVAAGGYGLRFNGDNGTGSSGVSGAAFTANHSGGTVAVSGGGGTQFNLGSSSGSNVTAYNLSGAGLLTLTGGSGWSIGADTAGTSTTTFTMSGGKIFDSGGMSGAQGAGARQAFVWNGGTLAVASYDATNLTSSSGTAVSTTTNTLTNAGGTLAPGDLGTPGRMTITGNYSIASPNAVLAIDIGGGTQATAFQDAASKYDNVAVSGTVALNGNLAVYLTNGYGPASSSTFTILYSTQTGASVTGAFQNAPFGGRMTTADGLGSFLVNLTGNSVVLSNFISLSKAPQITSQPQSLTVIAGKTATFAVSVVGATPFTYQWYNGSAAISGATLPWLALTNAGPASVGSYHAVISNSYGSATSNTVTLAVNTGSTGTGGMVYDMDQTPVAGTNAIVDTLGTTSGTFVGSPLPASIAGAKSYTGKAWNFGSGGANVAVGANAFTDRLGDIHQTTGITVGMWVNLAYHINSNMDNSRALCIGDGNDSVCDVTTSNGSGAFQFTFDGSFVVSSGAVLDGNWHHVVATLDYQKSANNLSLYVDGKAASNATVVVPASFSTPATTVDLGNRNTGGGGAFVGALDQAIVYDRALTAGEVSSVYATGALANAAPLVVVDATATTVQWPANTTTVFATVTDDGLPNPPGAVTGSWTKVSTPSGGSVTFGSAGSPSSTLTFSTAGTYVVRYTASDGQLSNYGDVTINVVANQPPVINSCSVAPTLLSSAAASRTVTLTASATDDGLPNPPGFLSTQWSQVSGPATVAIAYPTAFSTTASVPAVAGTYVVQFSASDGAATTTSNVTFTVASNLPPTVAATADNQCITWPANSTTLRAAVSDDGLPNPPGATTVQWQQVSGPAAATLGGASSANCPVTFPSQGQYVFQATASDGALSANATTYVTVWSPGRPIVLPGSTRSLWLPNAACTLAGTLQNVSGPNVPVQWSVVQGPGTVTFGTPKALTTTASFSAAGEYWIQLSATDGIYSNASRLAVEVYDPAVAPGQYGGGNFGYTGANAAYLNDFTGDLQLPYNFTGLDWSRLKPPPPAYVHPRIFFNPEDLPDLRNRLANASGNSTQGPALLQTITTTTQSLLTNQGATYNGVYNDLANGITTSFAAQGGNQQWIVCLLGYEAFRCLIANDTVGGAKAGAALAGVSAYIYPILAAKNSNDWQGVVFPTIYSEWMGYTYDFAYNFMTPAQQANVRQTLTLATTNAQGLGINALPAFHANSSNWNQWNGFYLVVDALAVEGETGYDPNLLPRLQGNFERMWSLDIFPEGSLFEGMGKGALYAESLIALGKRGIMIAAITGANNHVHQFYSACMETTGYAFMWEEWCAGNGQYGNNDTAKHADVPVIKYLFPNDPVVDFIHRNAFGTANYLTSAAVTSISDDPGDMHDLLGRTICTLDFDTSLTWTQAVAQQVTPNLPVTQFFNSHGMLMTRSDWTSNGLRLMFQPRSEPGGHAERDRNVFTLSALGRIWVPYGSPEPESYDYSIDSSVPRIDNVGPSTVAAKVVDFYDSPSFTYAAGDAVNPYSWTETGSPAAVEAWNYNQTLLQPDPQPWANLPWGVLPGWQYSTYSPLYWVPNTPVQRAFRTAALVRGTNPYVVLVDDLQKDGSAHNYADRIVLASDLTSVTQNGNDAIVTSSAGGNVSLLVRVLRCAGAPRFSSSINADQYNVLDIDTTAVAPNYIVLLLPYTNGTALPTTTWVGNVVNVQWPGGQVDHLAFTPNADGRTRVSFSRPSTDTTPPVLTLPSNITITATAPQGNVVTFTATALDNVDGPVPVTCVPPSGAVFPIGTTTVQCSAVDTSLNPAAGSFTVTVLPGAFTLTAPTGLTARPANLSTTVSWASVAPAASYNVYRSLSGGSYALVASGLTATSYVDTGLTNGTAYYYEVSAVNGTGEGPLSASVSSVPLAVPSPWVDQDLGSVGLAGSATISATGATAITAAGTGIGGSGDSFNFAAEPCTGNFVAVAHLTGFVGTNTNSVAGLMLRQSLAANAANAFMGIAAYSDQFYFSSRSSTGGGTASTAVTHSTLPQWFKLARTGTTVTAYDSGDSVPGAQTWTQVGSPSTVALTSPIYAGLAVAASSTSSTVTASFDHFGVYTPPTITPPANLMLEATGSNGATAAFAAAGASNVDGTLPAVCVPASGSTFPLGTTLVTATVTDGAGQTAAGTFTVKVVDTTPPAITVPANISVNATTAGGAHVAFATSATDLVSGSVTTTNTPASGSLFPIGATTVTTTADDAAGNLASKTFNVNVTVPPVGSQELIAPQVAIAGGNVNVVVGSSVPGRTYQLQQTNDLRYSEWQNVGSPVVGTGGALTISTPYDSAVPACFYRLLLGP